jgi:hypothetical protein
MTRSDLIPTLTVATADCEKTCLHHVAANSADQRIELLKDQANYSKDSLANRQVQTQVH